MRISRIIKNLQKRVDWLETKKDPSKSYYLEEMSANLQAIEILKAVQLQNLQLREQNEHVDTLC